MSPRDVVQLLRERWRVVVACVLVGLALSLGVTWILPERYVSTSTLYVTTQSAGDDARTAYDAILLAQQKVKSYVELFRDQRIAADASTRLNGAVAPRDVSAAVSASAAPDTTLIKVSVADTTPLGAQRLAGAITDSFVALVTQLEQPRAPELQPSVVVQVVQPASFEPTRVAPSWVVNAALGLLGGLAVGLAWAITRNAFDTTIKSTDRLHQLTEAPVLGTTSLDTGANRQPLTMRDAPSSPGAEMYRRVRTNLGFVGVDHPRRVIVGTSPVSGEGKSTALCNIAMALEQDGRSVALVDADLRAPKVGEYLGLDTVVGLSTVLSGRVSLDAALQYFGNSALRVLPSGTLPPNPSELLSSRQMSTLIERLRDKFEIVLIDAPPLLPVTDAAVLATLVDGALLFARYGSSTEREILEAATQLDIAHGKLLGTVLTAVPSSESKKYGIYAGHDTLEHSSMNAGRRVTLVERADVPTESVRVGVPSDHDVESNGHLAVRPSPRPRA